MSVFTLGRRCRLTAAVALSAGVLATGPVLLTPAHADTSAQASAKVQALLKKVHALQARARHAEARYSRAFNGVANSVNSAISADRESTRAEDHAANAEDNLMLRVRTLYESGGQLAADVSFLSTGSMTATYDRTIMARRVVAAQVSSVHDASIAARQAQVAAQRAENRSHAKIGTERTVAAAAGKVEGLLAQQRALLKQANRHLAAVRKAEAALAAQTASYSSITTASIAGLHILPPSAAYLKLYKAAAPTCPGLSWTVLAAIGQVESGHGRNSSTSSAGAMGPMQFMPGTFAAYAVDGDHDGKTEIMDPADAIYTAAHYLCANGAGRGPSALGNAILHYNHATWYRDMVLKLASMYAESYA